MQHDAPGPLADQNRGNQDWFENLKRQWHKVWFPLRFIVEVVVGSSLFYVVLWAMFWVNEYVHEQKTKGADSFLIHIATASEYVVAVGDISVFLVWFAREWGRAIKELCGPMFVRAWAGIVLRWHQWKKGRTPTPPRENTDHDHEAGS